MYGLDSSTMVELVTLRQQELIADAARARGRNGLSLVQRLSDAVDTFRYFLANGLIRLGERIQIASSDVECAGATE